MAQVGTQHNEDHLDQANVLDNCAMIPSESSLEFNEANIDKYQVRKYLVDHWVGRAKDVLAATLIVSVAWLIVDILFL